MPWHETLRNVFGSDDLNLDLDHDKAAVERGSLHTGRPEIDSHERG